MFKYENGEVIGNTKAQADECPNCGGDDIEYQPLDTDCSWDGTSVAQDCTCRHCGYAWTNWFRIAYDGFSDHSDHTYNADGEMD